MDPNGDGYIGVTLHPDLKPYLETQLLSIKPDRTVKITLMGYHDKPFEGKIDSVAWASLCRTVLAERRPAYWRRSTKPSIGFDSPNGSLSESKSLANLQFLSGSARQLLLRY